LVTVDATAAFARHVASVDVDVHGVVSENLATAERKFRSWIGSYSAVPSARIALAEQAADATWTELKAWPDGGA
jgi:hypothetical protein